MKDRDFDEYMRERAVHKGYMAAFDEYYGEPVKEERKDRIWLDDGCAWLRINEGSDEDE